MFTGGDVLEFGAVDINGSVRSLFNDPSCYVAVDWREGSGVTDVCLAHKYNREKKFDVVIATEMLEHDPYWKKTLANAYALLMDGGLLVLTCGTNGRFAHDIESSPKKGYYGNILEEDLEKYVEDNYFKHFYIDKDPNTFFPGLLFWGIKADRKVG